MALPEFSYSFVDDLGVSSRRAEPVARLTASDGSRGEKRTIVVVGATSDVGRIVAAKLSSQGHEVPGVARSLGIALSDRAALSRTFDGADSAYLMIPFDTAISDLHEHERQVAFNLSEAISNSGVRRAVLLSGLNAHLKMGTSLGAAEMEDRLEGLALPQFTRLRAGFFNENFIKGMAFAAQAQSGIFATPFRGDLPMPMIAARDVAERAALLLGQATWDAAPVTEVHGGGYYTFEELTAILAKAFGQTVTCRSVSLDEARSGMIASGMSASFADALVETAQSFNRGERWALEAPSPQNKTPTTFENWVNDTIVNAGASPAGSGLK